MSAATLARSPAPALAEHEGEQHDLQQQVAELAVLRRQVVGGDGVGELVHLFDGVADDVARRLLAVPGALHAQHVDDALERHQLLAEQGVVEGGAGGHGDERRALAGARRAGDARAAARAPGAARAARRARRRPRRPRRGRRGRRGPRRRPGRSRGGGRRRGRRSPRPGRGARRRARRGRRRRRRRRAPAAKLRAPDRRRRRRTRASGSWRLPRRPCEQRRHGVADGDGLARRRAAGARRSGERLGVEAGGVHDAGGLLGVGEPRRPRPSSAAGT